ncbi:MAG TPA: hypothetical protein VJV05_01620 [Pyrinomonadaceae bacterium]|nr:hypothetical protein [Pyrinomonadaceae bacterium]
MLTMNHKCPNCGLVNPLNSQTCVRCNSGLDESENISSKRRFSKPSIAKRASVCLAVLIATVISFYISLVYSADALTAEGAAKIEAGIRILEEKGFTDEVRLLRHVAVFRSTDNWLNASVEKESAYAATNFPFEIVTIYPDFFKFSTDDVESAAILLHEAKHLQGQDEKEAYEFVWKNRQRLGWTYDRYSRSAIWLETRKLTKELSPILFVCEFNEFWDCTES